ncbi:MAG: tetratricopeptide repeat-containing sensor histidine kinase [Imperialibacter sp.]|uniref:tetratricopeptide repeat-containing sensor histidine kinase n=1 Tax=Imperialibacter sp. TaxID=2038411 RepID=UPI0032ED44C3
MYTNFISRYNRGACVLLLFVFHSSFSQSPKADQAIPLYPLEKIFSMLRSQPDSAIMLLPSYFGDGNDSIKGKAYNYMGNAYYFKSNYDTAIQYFTRSSEIFSRLQDDENLSKNYNNMGVAHYFLSQYEKAFEFHKKALEIRERHQDPGITSTYNNLGLVLTDLGSTEEALYYYKKSLDAKIQYRQFTSLSTTLTNISNIYRDRNELDSALMYELKNLQHLDSLPDNRNLATCYNNLSISYLRLIDLKTAEFYALRALRLEKELQRGFELINVCKNLAEIYLQQKKAVLAYQYLDSVFLLVPNHGDYRAVTGVYLSQAIADSVKGNMGAAYFHMRKYMDSKVHFDELERKNLVLDLEKKYQGEIKEQKILKLEQAHTIKDLEAERSKLFRLFLIAIVILLMLAAAILYSRYRLKQKTAGMLDAKNKELQSLNQVKDRLFAIVSHDLKSPLSSFHTVTSTLNQYYEQISPDDIKRYLTKLETAAKSLEDQMKNLLEWSLHQISERSLKTEVFELRDMAEKLRSFFHLNLEVKRQNIYIEIEAPIHLETDKEYLQTVLRNLISNAIKFTPAEGSIWLRANVIDNNVIIEVEDSGIGIASDDFHKLFTLDSDKKSIGSSKEKGTGLGLVLVKEMIEKLGGTLALTSELGKGTTFTIRMAGKQLKKAA